MSPINLLKKYSKEGTNFNDVSIEYLLFSPPDSAAFQIPLNVVFSV